MSAYELLTYFVLIFAAVLFVFYIFWHDRRYEKKNIKDTISHRVRSEIDAERQAARKRKEKFESALRNHQI